MSLTDDAENRLLNTSTYRDGYDACIEGSLYEQNPHPVNSIEYKQWAEGYCDAEMLEQEDAEPN